MNLFLLAKANDLLCQGFKGIGGHAAGLVFVDGFQAVIGLLHLYSAGDGAFQQQRAKMLLQDIHSVAGHVGAVVEGGDGADNV